MTQEGGTVNKKYCLTIYYLKTGLGIKSLLLNIASIKLVIATKKLIFPHIAAGTSSISFLSADNWPLIHFTNAFNTLPILFIKLFR